MTGIVEQLVETIRPGRIFLNPGGGTSLVKRCDEAMFGYVRGRSRIYLPMAVVVEVVERWCGKEVSSSELRAWRPDVFDSSRGGHSCNCTFLFTILSETGISGAIAGAGKVGSPFSVHIREDAVAPGMAVSAANGSK